MIVLSASPSSARLAFVHFLRTGRQIPEILFDVATPLEAKFNPYHDPHNGQFTFGPGGGGAVSDGVFRPDREKPSRILTGASSARRGIGGNGGPPLDPLMIEQVFPGLSSAPAGAVLALTEPILDLMGPGSRLTSGMSLDYAKTLIRQIQEIDPTYKFQSLGFPSTIEGQIRQTNDLRWDRAVAIYRATGNAKPLQFETLRYLQERTDIEYDNALALAKAGKLPRALNEGVAIGNYIDRAVKRDLREYFMIRGLINKETQAVRVNGREYDSSGDERTYSIPDARVGDIAFDVTLWRKTPGSQQVSRFFRSDFRPRSVIIIRPKQLGSGSTYLIKRPGK